MNWAKLINMCELGLTTLNAFSAELNRDSELTPNGTLLVNYLNPALFVTLMNNDDNPTLSEAMNGPDSASFMVAMEKEIETIIIMKAFVVVSKESWMNVISSVWAFKRIRFPDGSIRKLKARICA